MQSLGSCKANLTDYKPIFKAAMGMRKKLANFKGHHFGASMHVWWQTESIDIGLIFGEMPCPIMHVIALRPVHDRLNDFFDLGFDRRLM